MTTQQVHADITEAQKLKDDTLLAVAYSTAADHYARMDAPTAKGLATKYANLASKWETRAALTDACMTLDA